MQKSNWKKCKLKNLVKINSSSVSKKDNLEHIVYLDTGNITMGKIEELAEFAYSEAPSRAKRKVKENSIVYSMVRPNQRHYGLIKNPTTNLIVSTGFAVLDTKEFADSKYIYYWLTQNHITDLLQSIAENSTSAYPAIRPVDLENLDISLPPLDEQKRIAEILGSLDDKIELLQKQNKTLEDMAKALFKSWFVDFDVVRAKQKGLPKADIMREYHLTEDLYDLFPSSFADSSLGPIPSGWDVKPLSKIAVLTMGQSPAGTTYNETGEGLPFYQGRTDFAFRFPKKRMYCSAPTRIAEKGDILISVRAPVGDLNMANETCCIGRGVASIRSNISKDSFLYYAMLSAQTQFDVFNTEGTVFGSINRKDLSSFSILTPIEQLVKEFNNIIRNFDLKIEENLKQIQTLTELRDTLLPRLISGKIRV